MPIADYTDFTQKFVRVAAVLAVVILGGSVVAEYFIPTHALPGFYAGFGFISCVGIVLVSKGLGAWIKRKTDYYDDA